MAERKKTFLDMTDEQSPSLFKGEESLQKILHLDSSVGVQNL